MEPSLGHVMVKGRDIAAMDAATLRETCARHIGMVFQSVALLPQRNVLENAAFGLEVQGVPRDSLLRIEAHGRLTLAERATLDSEVRADDLDLFDRGGALRKAAKALMSEGCDPALAQAERDLADQALSRLYALVQEVDA